MYLFFSVSYEFALWRFSMFLVLVWRTRIKEREKVKFNTSIFKSVIRHDKIELGDAFCHIF